MDKEHGKADKGDLQQKKVTSPAYLKTILQERNLSPRRSMGQNFLVDDNILEKIISAATLHENDLVIDIGAGPGALSLAMAGKVAGVIAVEWDEGLSALLQEQALMRGLNRLHVVKGDVRRLDLDRICREKWGEILCGGAAAGELKVVANLPYYLITPLLFKLLQGRLPIKLLVVMVQLEVARRILAVPGGKEYGVLSVLCRYYTEPRLLFKVSRHVFFPSPEVDSAVVLLDVLGEPPVKVKDKGLFWKIVRAAFQKRRKTILNALHGLGDLSKGDWEKILQKCGISPMQRGETLSLDEFANLSEMFYNS
ncbi:MAG: 16S rRNA (adenine(1518)-N(6)/adenine(1519)-N(6))-dimethyltransferase RsmA [Dethiobacter sp.]|jgi:16S rRNA (adenine1518-N6/adenine1519-N6)-dimethyltransferase|nr:MAG: 16S rRNA (adenine(1518)-N(6)/adenine(1519)-N(6))-dimethyltransferase RsmA [Dethiobacter sp.]